MRIGVVGAGAVGGYFGGRLGQGGNELVVVARGEHLAAIRRDGLRIRSVAGDAVVRPAETADDPATVAPVEAVLLGVKSWQVPDAAAALAPMLRAGACVVPLQNGIEAPEQIDRALGPGHAMGGFCRILSRITAPGEISHSGVEPYVAFGELSGGGSPRAERLLDAFARSPGVRAELLPDIRREMWRKFLLITSWGAVGASSGATVGEVRTRPDLREHLVRAMWEIVAVALAHEVALGADDVGDTLAFLGAAPPEGTTSMQRDLAAGRRSELDAQVGAVVRLARARGVEVPYHAAVLRALQPPAHAGR
jgi:2-dehydropantoate 2-reductase